MPRFGLTVFIIRKNVTTKFCLIRMSAKSTLVITFTRPRLSFGGGGGAKVSDRTLFRVRFFNRKTIFADVAQNEFWFCRKFAVFFSSFLCFLATEILLSILPKNPTAKVTKPNLTQPHIRHWKYGSFEDYFEYFELCRVDRLRTWVNGIRIIIKKICIILAAASCTLKW